jgi:hypothetical protein
VGATDVAERHCPRHMTREPKKLAVWEAENEEMQGSKSHTGWKNPLSLSQLVAIYEHSSARSGSCRLFFIDPRWV